MQTTNEQQAGTTNPDALPRGFPCVLQTDHLQWNEQVVKKEQFGQWKLILLNSEKFHPGNVAILKRDKDLVLIDSGCAKNYTKLVEQITKKDYSPFFLVNTHAHPDHIGANEKMVKEGAIVLAHHNAREHMVGYGVPEESGLPVVTFRRRMSIHAGDQRMRLIGLAPGHTDGDIAVWVPDMNILHTGDIFMSSDYPLIDANSGGTISGLIKSLKKVIRLSNRETVVIPGHGDLAGRKQLVQYRKMLRDVKKNVEYNKDMGLDLESIKDLNLTKKHDHKWGQGDLITGRQFVGFVYNTLEDKAAHSHSHSSSISEKSSVHQHPSNDSNRAPWELSFDVSKIETSSDRKGRLILGFQSKDATTIDAINNENHQQTNQLAIKKLAKNFDELTGHSLTEASLTYSHKKRLEKIDFHLLDFQKKRRQFAIKSDIVEQINELSMIHQSKPCASTESECEQGLLIEQATFTINMPFMPGYD